MTDTPAHTPLPWHVVEYDAGDCAHYDHNGPCPGIFPDDKYDTCVIHWDGFKQQYWSSANGDQRQIKANAAFIVRACNSHYQLVDALREAIDAIEDDRGLDDYICCSGYMCGCQGSSKRQLMLHLRAALSQAGGASE